MAEEAKEEENQTDSDSNKRKREEEQEGDTVAEKRHKPDGDSDKQQ